MMSPAAAPGSPNCRAQSSVDEGLGQRLDGPGLQPPGHLRWQHRHQHIERICPIAEDPPEQGVVGCACQLVHALSPSRQAVGRGVSPAAREETLGKPGANSFSREITIYFN